MLSRAATIRATQLTPIGIVWVPRVLGVIDQSQDVTESEKSENDACDA